MQKLTLFLSVLMITAIIAGCGGSDSTTTTPATTVSGVTKDTILDTEVSGKILFSRSLNGIVAYQLNADAGKTAGWNSSPVPANTDPLTSLDVTGTWNVTNGTLVLTPNGGGTPVQFTRIQKENSYWLIYNTANIINRFYWDLATAQAYNPAQIGGTVLGGSISTKFSNYSVSTYAGIAKTAGFANNSTATLMTTATFNRPMGITTDGTDFYVADYVNSLIRKITPATQKVTTLTGLTDSTGLPVSFYYPSDITTDGINVFVADSGSNVIRIISGTTVTTIGSTTAGAGSVDSAIAADVRFNVPTGITTDGTNLYVTDSGNNTIRKIVISSKAVTTLAGSSGSPGYANGIQTAARFNLPACITTDGSNLYLTDFNNRVVRKIVIATGEVSTIAGIAGKVGSADTAPGVTATFYHPNGITTDGTNLYVTDTYNNTIRKINIASGNVTTMAGTAGIKGHVDSPGTPSFDSLIGITSFGSGIYVADSLNHTIRKIK